jgi:threonine/homoserine/homoserine lactone efflux protein
MPAIDTLLIFTAAALLMNISPGPSNFYVMSRSIAQGPRGGAVAAMGLAFGSLVHVLAAAFGLAATFHYFPSAYVAVKILGAAYLIYLGIRFLLDRDGRVATVAGSARRPHRQILAESVLVEILNPKTALFFIAFLPQFVDVSRGPPGPQLLILGTIVTLSGIPCDLFVAWASGSAAKVISQSAGLRRLQMVLSGTILISLGLYVALTERAD